MLSVLVKKGSGDFTPLEKFVNFDLRLKVNSIIKKITISPKNNLGASSKGFTLIEFILYISLLSILLLALSGFYGLVLRSRVKAQTIAEVEQSGVQIVQIISQSIRNASAINSPTTGNNATSLSLAVVNAGQSPTIFNLSGGVVQIKEGVATAIDLSNNRVTVSNLIFYNLSRASTPGIISFQFTVSKINASGRNELDFSKIFYASAALR